MPQWTRDRTGDSAKYPDERARADARRDVASLLRRYDHHVVRVAGRAALLLTYHWDLDEPSGSTVPVVVSFTYPAGHPAAPDDVQAIIDTLAFDTDLNPGG